MEGLKPDGSTPGALYGHAHLLEYYDDGYPVLPAILHRRPKKILARAA